MRARLALPQGAWTRVLRLLRRQEAFFGWRLHLVCTTDGVPVTATLLPASYHDLTPIHELLSGLPPDAWVHADKAYHSASDEASILHDTSVRLVAPAQDHHDSQHGRRARRLAHLPHYHRDRH